jgi:hypothetical protein
MARPEVEIDETQVRKLAEMGCTHEEIAAFFGVHRNTIGNRFRDLIEESRHKGNASLRRRMFEEAMNGSERMMMWLSKQYLGMSDKTEHSGEGLRPLTIEFAEVKKEDTEPDED